RKNRTAHIDYIRHTQEEAATLRELVESKRLLSPLNTSLAYACNASGSKSQDNTKKNRIRRTQKKAKETELEDHLRNVKSSLNKASVVDSTATSSVIKLSKSSFGIWTPVVQKFLGTVKFGNDHVAKIMGYGDYQ
nr:hypothetical protein [Tanacetum cinerariifolium]